MTSIFGAAFDRLDKTLKKRIVDSLKVRRLRYMSAMAGRKVPTKFILLADTPGPGRPADPDYHHTPFYSTKNSSLWINRLLAEAQVNEEALLWFNTTLTDGSPLSSQIFFNQIECDPTVICLGGNAEKWLQAQTLYRAPYEKVFHPQAWKRFRSSEPYPLLEHLK